MQLIYDQYSVHYNIHQRHLQREILNCQLSDLHSLASLLELLNFADFQKFLYHCALLAIKLLWLAEALKGQLFEKILGEEDLGSGDFFIGVFHAQMGQRNTVHIYLET